MTQANVSAPVPFRRGDTGPARDIHKDRWKATRDPTAGQRAHTIYLRAYQLPAATWTGVNAAGMSRLLEGPEAFDRPLAEQVKKLCELKRTEAEARLGRGEPVRTRELYWIVATLGEAELLLGNETAAIAHYREAATWARRENWTDGIVSSLRQLRLYRSGGIPVPDELFEILKPPAVFVFVGHMIDPRAELRHASRPHSSLQSAMPSGRRVDGSDWRGRLQLGRMRV